MGQSPFERLAAPAVISLILFLALSSQWLFYYIEPGPLDRADARWFNGLVAALLICYYRTWTTDPGRVPSDWSDRIEPTSESDRDAQQQQQRQNQRWCRKCNAYKPPRAHHCKTCERCIMKMDHHCVWTANCVCHTTLPHFIRFLVFAVTAMSYLEIILFIRVAIIWQKRHLPSYLGPTPFRFAHLFCLVSVNSFVLFILVLLLGRTIWSLALNMTTIEGWEVERHHAVLRRARNAGGLLDGPDGARIRIEHQEFPWDVGIWSNICHGMGSANPLVWLWPFASTPSIQSGLAFEHNGIDDPSKPWPPPDPDKMFRAARYKHLDEAGVLPIDRESFLQRQQADQARYEAADDGEYLVRRRPFHERLATAAANHSGRDDFYPPRDDDAAYDDNHNNNDMIPDSRRTYRVRAWRNEEGEHLADYGVDEDAEFDDEDNVPLAQVKQRLQHQRRSPDI